jgi:hypothetical protein
VIGDPDGDGGDDPDFFVSYTRSDQGWAEWIGWVLDDAGFRSGGPGSAVAGGGVHWRASHPPR